MATDPVAIRALQSEDLAAVIELEQQLFSHPWNRSRFETALSAGYLLLGCESGRKLRGYLVISHGGGVADLLTIGVDRARQGSGMARQLLEAAVDRLRTFEVDELLLEVRESNQRAIGFYLKQGFEQVGTRNNYYPTESGREHALVFKRSLVSRS